MDTSGGAIDVVICTSWEMLPDNVDWDGSYDISALPGPGPERHKTVRVEPGRAVTVLGADDRCFRNLSFCLTGHNTLRLISVHLLGGREHPPVSVSGPGNRIVGERAVELMSDDRHAAVHMAAGGEVGLLRRGPCRYTVDGLGD